MLLLFNKLIIGWFKTKVVPVKQLLPFHRTDFYKVAQYARMPRETYPPITCRKSGDYYAIIDGHHRWQAAIRRGDATVRIKHF
jgi:hypothetical protein